MAGESTLPFDTLSINGVAVPNTTFIWGSGVVRSNKQIISNTLGDGAIAKAVLAVDIEGNCELVGDQTALSTDAPDQDKIEVLGVSLYGSVTAKYSQETDRTALTFRGKTTDDGLGLAVKVAGTTGGVL